MMSSPHSTSPSPPGSMVSNGQHRQSNQSLEVERIVREVLSELSTATQEFRLSYASIDSTTANEVFKQLDRQVEGRYRGTYNSDLRLLKLLFMFSYIHECTRAWLVNYKSDMLFDGVLSRRDSRSLQFLGSPRVNGFSGIYASSIKEPDMCIQPLDMSLPTVIVEVGWSETRAELYRDRDLWLYGGRGSIQLVLVVKWSKTVANQVKGEVEVFELDATGQVHCLQRHSIFPAPSPSVASLQRIIITKGQLFGPVLPAGQLSSDQTVLFLDDLRVIASEYILKAGLALAV